MSAGILHRARWVLPVSGPAIADGALIIGADDTILAVGGATELLAAHDGAIREHGEAVLMPGLVNTHTHLELSALEGRIPSTGELADWLVAVTVAALELSEEEADRAAAAAIEAASASGTVLVGDISNSGRTTALLADSRLHARVFHELLGFDPRDAGMLFGEMRDLLLEQEATSAGGPRLRLALAAHAPYSVSSRLLRLIRGFNAASGRPTSIHLAESTAEDLYFTAGCGPIAAMKERFGTTLAGWEPPGQSSVAYLQRIGWFEGWGIAVHCTQLGARGIEILRRSACTACLCPRSNENLGVGVAPARALIDAGVPVALGTDSLAGVDSLNLFDELAAAARLYAGVEPAALVRAATQGGAVALGFADELGTLEAGKRGAAIAVAGGGAPIADPYELLLSCPGAGCIEQLSTAAATTMP